MSPLPEIRMDKAAAWRQVGKRGAVMTTSRGLRLARHIQVALATIKTEP